MPAGIQRRFPLTSPLPRLAVLAAGLIAFALLARGVLAVSATTDWRIRRVLRLQEEVAALRAEYPYELHYAIADRAAFAERIVYWQAGFHAFEQYPLMGVGVGNAGFLFEEGVPTFGRRLPEIRRVLNPENASFPNPKSLWIRLLAETGFVGTAAFLSWIVLMLAGALALARGFSGELKLVGVAGLLCCLAWMLEGFSLDTFALPQTWLVLGLVTAMQWNSRRQSVALAPSRPQSPH
jgi:O-antigen ligase